MRLYRCFFLSTYTQLLEFRVLGFLNEKFERKITREKINLCSIEFMEKTLLMKQSELAFIKAIQKRTITKTTPLQLKENNRHKPGNDIKQSTHITLSIAHISYTNNGQKNKLQLCAHFSYTNTSLYSEQT